eukprot:SAG11_NODE_2253_length_3630_cov_9.405551_4_plen_69_part_00
MRAPSKVHQRRGGSALELALRGLDRTALLLAPRPQKRTSPLCLEAQRLVLARVHLQLRCRMNVPCAPW